MAFRGSHQTICRLTEHSIFEAGGAHSVAGGDVAAPFDEDPEGGGLTSQRCPVQTRMPELARA